MATTYQEIIDRAKSRVDMTQSSFVSTDDWTEFLRDSYRNLYNKLVSKFQEHFLEPAASAAIDSDGQLAVPADFQRLHAVDVEESGEWTTVWPANLSERNRFRGGSGIFLRRNPYIKYRLIKRDVWFFPAERASGKTARVWYTPLPAKISTLSDSIPIEMEQWSQHMVLDCCIMALLKEESDPSGFMAERQLISLEIDEQAMLRDLQAQDQVEDVTGGSWGDDEVLRGRY